MDAAQWPQVGLARAMEEIISSSNPTQTPPQQQQQQHQGGLDSNNQRRARPQKDQTVNCPRCNSTNTKFCYYNNYSLTQPRYFCKTCRRYWTQGGSLRNVPVGGGSRKNKRSTPPSSSSSIPIPNPTKLIPDLNPPTNFLMPPHNHLQHQNPSNKIHPHPHHHGQDLNLAFPSMIQPMELPKIETTKLLVDLSNTCSSASTSAPISSALELLRTNISSSSLNSYGPVPIPADSNPLYTSSRFASLQEMKPSLMGSGFNIGGLQENTHQASGGVARLLFPFGDINKFSNHHNATSNNTTRSDHQGDTHQSIKGSSQDHDHHQGGNGYWNGMLGGGGW